MIIDYTGQPETRQHLADVLGIDPRYITSSPPADAPTPLARTDIVLIVGQDYRPAWAGEE